MAVSISFTGKKILITGGAGGLGRSLVQKLYEQKAVVFVLDRDESSLAELRKEYPTVTAVQVDLTDFEKTRKVVESFGPLDHLVNNAGILVSQTFMEIDMDTLQKTFDVNFNSYVVVGQTVARGMIENKIQGSIVNIASTASLRATPSIASYCCSKAAVAMLTKIMAIELGEHNIRVNSISPCPMDTPMIRKVPGLSEEQLKEIFDTYLGSNIIKRLLQTNKAADLILFLLSSTAAMITGENVFIDGGNTIS